ncbi:MAG: MBL fold metallo-hydrolase [Clostridiaceae bacterium]|nr:MBL fold metallo-hydrolase [Clostridiaceae bacterium]
MHLKTILKRAIIVLLMPSLFCFSLIACSKPANKDTGVNVVSNKDKPKANPISIKYIGNSCFYITFSDGTRLVTDPYGSRFSSNFGEFPKLEADVMTISHNHADHTSGISEVKGNPKIIQPEHVSKPIKVGKVEITSYLSKHVANMGDNIIFVYKEDGYKIVHMGETDSIDSVEAQEAVKDADVILAYTGEYGSVTNKDSFVALNKMNIKVVIPQHYSMDEKNIFYGGPTIDKILTELPQGTKVTKSKEFIVKKALEKQFVELTSMNNK